MFESGYYREKEGHNAISSCETTQSSASVRLRLVERTKVVGLSGMKIQPFFGHPSGLLKTTTIAIEFLDFIGVIHPCSNFHLDDSEQLCVAREQCVLPALTPIT
jgi:hypothetical protein